MASLQQPPRPVGSALRWRFAICASLVAACAMNCSANGDPSGETPSQQLPASSADRARARSQRKARGIALSEQSSTPLSRRRRKPPKPLPPPPKPTASASASAKPGDEPPKPASSASASASAKAAAPPPPLCPTLCAQVVKCFQKEMTDDRDVGPEIREIMLRSIKRGEERCVEQCKDKLRNKSETFEKDARACMAEDDCDKLTECARILQAK